MEFILLYNFVQRLQGNKTIIINKCSTGENHNNYQIVNAVANARLYPATYQQNVHQIGYCLNID